MTQETATHTTTNYKSLHTHIIMDWKETIKRAHKTAVEHGFWDAKPNYLHLAMLVITELSEAIDADRHGRYADRGKYEDMCRGIDERVPDFAVRIEKRKEAFDMCIKDTVEDELADACIRLMDMMGQYESVIISDEEFTADAGKPLTEFCFCATMALMAPLGEKYALEKAIDMILAYARRKHIDIEWHICEKMAYNEQRPRYNGKKY